MADGKTRVGVIGAGGLGQHHVRIMSELPDATLVGFHESRPERAAEIASTLKAKPFASLDELLDSVDAVTIVVPTPAHYEVAKEALARGVHVLVEKPFTATIEQADELLELAKEKGALVQIGHVERFNRAIRAALPYVDQPKFIESDRLAPFNPRGSDVAVVLDLMIHDIDLILTLVGEQVMSVSAVGVGVLTPSVDIANARLGFITGAVANITASRVSRERMRKVRIFQQSGYLSLDLGAGNGEFFRLRKDVDLAELARAPLALESFVERVPLEAPEGEPLRLEFESFLAAVQGRAPVSVAGEEGRAALAVALQIVREIERSLPALSGTATPRAR
ncbi:MAG: Gfo/Idh/MocA family oxidoreductase [Gemmatimonadaceae bacterium]|nr:Gfo/Idh/MocA family oxidoreductase [Gemmatimonadaceae bacterium]